VRVEGHLLKVKCHNHNLQLGARVSLKRFVVSSNVLIYVELWLLPC
jgi:hypothetical protein